MWDSSTYQMLQNIYNRLGELLSQSQTNGTNIESVVASFESTLSNLQTQVNLLTYLACIGFGFFAFYVVMKWVKR